MQKSLLIILFLGFSAARAPAQAGKLILKEDTPTIPAVQQVPSTIKAEAWDQLESFVLREDWHRAALLSKEYLDSLGTETSDRQIARLRYIYMYSLAGKIISHAELGEKTDEELTRKQLEQAAANFTGKEFVFPVRTIMANCSGGVNYVCESMENPGFLRIAATNRAGTAIHLFEYIDMHSFLDVIKHNKKEVILGGFLKASRFNSGEPYKGLMVLQFENGFVRNIYGGK